MTFLAMLVTIQQYVNKLIFLFLVEYHLAQNVEQRRTVMEDIKAAKLLQDEEDKRAKILTLDEQEELLVLYFFFQMNKNPMKTVYLEDTY